MNLDIYIKKWEKKIQREHKLMSQEKLSKMIHRLLTVGVKKEPKPILVLYFTHTTMKLENFSIFLQRISKNVNGRYFILALPVINAEEVRVELWYKGKKQSHESGIFYENNIWVFNDLLRMND